MKSLLKILLLSFFLFNSSSLFAMFTFNFGLQRSMKTTEKLNKMNYGIDLQDRLSDLDLIFKSSGEYGKYEKGSTRIMIQNYLFVLDLDYFLVDNRFSLLTYHSYKIDVLAKTVMERNNGAGVKYYLFHADKNNNFSISAMGLDWKKEYLDKNDKTYFRLSFRPKYSVSLANNLVFKTAVFYKPKANSWKDYILESESFLDFQIKPNLVLSPTYKISYYRQDDVYEEAGMLIFKLIF